MFFCFFVCLVGWVFCLFDVVVVVGGGRLDDTCSALAVLGSPSLIVLTVSVDVKQH